MRALGLSEVSSVLRGLDWERSRLCICHFLLRMEEFGKSCIIFAIFSFVIYIFFNFILLTLKWFVLRWVTYCTVVVES